MITTHWLHSETILQHSLAGPFDPVELRQAVEETQRIGAAGQRVVWDVREADLDALIYSDAKTMLAEVNQLLASMGTGKRAFVVRSSEQREVVIMIIGHMSAPWPWDVFFSVDEAVAYLRKNPAEPPAPE